jgi:hypothetical protein
MISPHEKVIQVVNYLERVTKKLDAASQMVWITDTGEVDELSTAITRLKEIKAEIEQSSDEYDYLIKRCIQFEVDLAVMKAHVEKVQQRLDDIDDLFIAMTGDQK